LGDRGADLFFASGLLGGPDVNAWSVRSSADVPRRLHIIRWRPLVWWLLAIAQLMIAGALHTLRQVLLLISLFTVLFTERIPGRCST